MQELPAELHIACIEQGDGIPIVFLHGGGGDHAHWQRVLGELAAMHLPVRAIMPELYGCGASPAWLLHRDIQVADHVAAIAHALEKRLDAPAVMVAHSLGGAVALQLALQHPRLVSHLVVIEPGLFNLLRTGRAEDADLLEHLALPGRQLYAAGKSSDRDQRRAAAEVFIDYWSGPGTWQRLPDALQSGVIARMAAIGGDFICLYEDRIPASRYAELQIPVLVVRGERSPQPARRIAELLAGAIPQASLAEIPGAGHMLPLSHPGQIAALVQRELALERA